MKNNSSGVTAITALSVPVAASAYFQRIVIARIHRGGRNCSLFPNGAQVPKLDAGGSSPISHFIFSMTYKESDFSPKPLFEVVRHGKDWNYLIAGYLDDCLGAHRAGRQA